MHAQRRKRELLEQLHRVLLGAGVILVRQGQLRARIGQIQGRLGELATFSIARIPRDKAAYGSRVTVEDLDSGEVWAAAGGPRPPREVRFAPHLAELTSRQADLVTRVTVAVAPDEDLEARLVRIANLSDRPRRLALTSYGEVALAPVALQRFRYTARELGGAELVTAGVARPGTGLCLLATDHRAALSSTHCARAKPRKRALGTADSHGVDVESGTKDNCPI